jgi:hypothetical protein
MIIVNVVGATPDGSIASDWYPEAPQQLEVVAQHTERSVDPLRQRKNTMSTLANAFLFKALYEDGRKSE